MKNIRNIILSCVLILAFQQNIQALNTNISHINFHPQDQIPADLFIRQAAFYMMKIYQISGIVINGSSNQKIKLYANGIIDEHSASNGDLTNLAKAKNIVLPMSKPLAGQRPDQRVDSAPENLRDTSRNQNTGAEAGNNGQPLKEKSFRGINPTSEKEVANAVDQLKDLKDVELDKKYVNMMVADHKNAILLFQSGTKSNDASVKNYASKYLPVLKKHLSEILAISQK